MKRSKSESPEPCNAQSLNSDAKRSKLTHEEKKYIYGLLDLSDDVLLHIFKYLSSFDLMALHLCCLRLHELCCDRTLWRSLDLRDKHVPIEELEKYTKFMQPSIKLLAISGNRRKNEYPTLQPQFLRTISEKCDQLQDCIIEDYIIIRNKISIKDFPKTLQLLSLKGCHVLEPYAPMSKSYLCFIDVHMPNLTSLILTNCRWLNSHALMPISKIPHLKELKLNSCYGLNEDIAYASLACRYGLKSLEVLDLRDTFVGDSVISSFSHASALTEIYLECPNPETVPYNPEEEFVRHEQEVLYVQLPRGEDIDAGINHIGIEQINEIDEAIRRANRHLPQFQNFENIIISPERGQISDRSVCTLGLHNNENNQEIIQNRDEVQLIQGRPRTSTNQNLRKVVVRNYTGVTNQILHHFAVNGPKLEYLDVIGTSVTKEALEFFKIQRPDVRLFSSFGEI